MSLQVIYTKCQIKLETAEFVKFMLSIWNIWNMEHVKYIFFPKKPGVNLKTIENKC